LVEIVGATQLDGIAAVAAAAGQSIKIVEALA
jgi:hypothetical protein